VVDFTTILNIQLSTLPHWPVSHARELVYVNGLFLMETQKSKHELFRLAL
jgi:hypothetical protein